MVDDVFRLPEAGTHGTHSEIRHSGIVSDNVCDPETNEETEVCLTDGGDEESMDMSMSESVQSDFGDDSVGDIVSDLREVVNDINISQNDLTKLLHVLQKYHPELPREARTLLNTPRGNVSDAFRHVTPGNYFHFGLKKGLLFVSEKLKIRDEVLFIQVNFDGLPIHKSTTKSFWPILCSIYRYPKSIFLVGAYYGSNKPEDPNDYLRDFIHELNDVLCNGLNGFHIKFRCCSCDTPARHFVLNVKTHGAYYGCERCCQKGVTTERRRVFLEMNSIQRTDFSFRSRDQSCHHYGSSPFEAIQDIDMVSDFPIDYMHSVCRGVTFKMLEELRTGDTQRLSSKLLHDMSTKLEALRTDVVSEFSRKPRSMKYLGMWKATELRLFLLYLAPIVIPKYCSPEYALCFNSLTVVTRIFTSPHDNAYFCYAKELIKTAVTQLRDIFGDKILVYNVHSLCHIADDVEKFGTLDSFSCFQYENFLRFVKRVVRSPRLPLQQLINRVYETDQCLGHCISDSKPFACLSSELFLDKENVLNFPMIDDSQYFRKLNINSGSCVIEGNSTADQYVCLTGSPLRPFKVAYFAFNKASGNTYIIGWTLKVVGDVFEAPLPSNKIGFLKVSPTLDTQNLPPSVRKLSDVTAKGMLLDGKYFVSVLHTQFLFSESFVALPV